MKTRFIKLVSSVIFIFNAILASFFCLNSNAKAENITVSAAASLTQVLTECVRIHKIKHPNSNILLQFAASGVLRTQIEQGAPIDIFIPAIRSDINYLLEKNLLEKDSLRTFARNSLVLVTPLASAKITIDDLEKQNIKRIAIGNPLTVAAGKYTKESLIYLKKWDSIAPKIIYTESVRQVVDYVERGEVQAGFVFASDSQNSKGSQFQFLIPSNWHSSIEYTAAIIKKSNAKNSAQFFIDSLATNCQPLFVKLGFK